MRVTGTTPIKTLNINCLLILAVLATACNSDSSSDVVTSVAAPDRTVSGQVAKGPLDGALVEVFAVDDHGQAQGPAIATSLTDANGNWAVSLSADDQPLLVRSSGGRYVDEADPEPDPAQRRSVTLQPDDQFEALLPPTLSSIAINAYTNALLRKSRAETQGADFLAVHATNREFYSRAFGFDLLSTIPADPIAPAASASADAVAYSQALGGIANVINAVAIANGQAIADFAAIDAVIDDLTNCSIDGRSIDGDVGPIVMVTRDLNAEILRFRNNNFAAHSGRGLLQISLAECQRSGRLPDRTAPQFSNVPASVTIAASSAAGATVAEVGAVLGGIEAIDDRDGPVSIDFGLDAPLPLGNNSLTISASDAAGNSATSTIEVVVADLDPPTITAPVSVDVMSVGVLTQVTLGAPQVADNVTATASLQVSNDAPADGFTVGIHLVTWTVSDAAGLSASAQQQVIVRNQAPVLSNAVGDQQAIEGQPFTLDLSAVFTDTDSLLVLTLAGLPDGSGLLFDGQQLFGVPTDADAQAAPLQLDLVAMDETTPVATSFVLAVTDANNAPSFSVVNSLTLAEDFVTPAMLTVESDPADGPSSPTFSLDQGTVDFASLAIDPQSGSVSISSLPDANGQGVFTITADDGAAVNNLFSQQVSLQVTPVNDVPVFVFDGSIAVVPGFNGSATVNVVPAAVPADEANETVLYSMNHAIPWATISIDSSNGAVTISDVANIVAAGLIAVTADDGNGGQHTEMLSLVVRESDKTLYAGELSGPLIDPISPVFPDPDEVPLSYRASGLPPSLAIDTANGAISGIPTSDDVQTGVFAASITVTGTFGTEATFPLTLNVVERDVDLDGLPDRFEPGLGIDPTQDDSDADGVVDGVEQAVGSDPLDPGAKIVKLSDDDGLQWLAAAQLGFASEQAPLFVLLAPGVYNSVLQLNPPCDYIHVVGGVDAAGETPDDSTPTLLAAGVQFEGCQASSLQHVHIFAESGAAVAVAGSDVLLTQVSLGGQDQDGLDVNASNVVISDSVIDLQGLGGLADATSSTLLFADSLLCTSGSAHFALDNSDVELVRVEAPAELLATPGVLVDTPVQRQRVQPDLGSFTVTDDAVYLDLWYHEFALTRGYDVAVHANGSPLSVFDINDGRYIVLVDDNADMQNITLRVNGHPVDYVIDTADND